MDSDNIVIPGAMEHSATASTDTTAPNIPEPKDDANEEQVIRDVIIDHLSDSDVEDLLDSGLPYCDHNYFPCDPYSKRFVEKGNFPIIKGLSELHGYVEDESRDIEAQDRSEHTRPTIVRHYGPGQSSMDQTALIGSSLHHTAVLSNTPINQPNVLRKHQLQAVAQTIPSGYRSAKMEEYTDVSPGYQQSYRPKVSTVPIPHTNVTLPKKAGRPSKEIREHQQSVPANRLMAAAMVKAGYQSVQGLQHPSSVMQQQSTLQQDMTMVRPIGTAPLVKATRGPQPQPRGRSANRRELMDDGADLSYGNVQQPTGVVLPPLPHQQQQSYQHQQQSTTAQLRSSSISPRKVLPTYRSAQAAEDAHSREMMEAAQNALAPPTPQHVSGSTTQSVLLSPVHHALPPHMTPLTPGRNTATTPDVSGSPYIDRRTLSESHSDTNYIHSQMDHFRTNADGQPITPGGSRRGGPRSRSSNSSSTFTSPTHTIHGLNNASTSSSSTGMIQMIPPSPRRALLNVTSHVKSPIGGVMGSGPSTMISAQMGMTTNVQPSFHHQQQQTVHITRQPHMGVSPSHVREAYYDVPGCQPAPLLSTSGSGSYAHRGRRSNNKSQNDVTQEEATNDEVDMIVSKIRERQPVSPRNDTLSQFNPRSAKQTNKRGGRKSSLVVQKEASSDEELEEEQGPWEVDCICGVKEDDGAKMVACDTCIRWQHIKCVLPGRKDVSEDESYFCTYCKPRSTNKEEEVRQKLESRRKKRDEEHRKSTVSSTHRPSRTSIPHNPALSYKEVAKNEFSNNARRYISLSANRSSGVHQKADILDSLQKKKRAFKLICALNTYGLVAEEALEEGSYIIELIGQVVLPKDCNQREHGGAQVPYTFLLEEEKGEKIIIDARRIGNDARFVRRSCNPNAKLSTLMSGSEMHVMIVAIKPIERNQEVTIAQDSDYDQSSLPVDCICCEEERGTCIIEKFNRQLSFKNGNEFVPGRRSPATNGTHSTPKGGRTPPPRKVLSERKKGAVSSSSCSSMSVASKKGGGVRKGKKGGSIRLQRHSRKSKSTVDTDPSIGGDTEDDEMKKEEEDEKKIIVEDMKEKDEEKKIEKEEENVKEEDEEKEKEEKSIRRKTNTDEEKASTPSVPTRMSTRIRTDSEMKKEDPEPPKKEKEVKKDMRRKEFRQERDRERQLAKISTPSTVISSGKRGRWANREPKEKVKEEPEPSTSYIPEKVDNKEEKDKEKEPKLEKKKYVKVLPEMDYTLPSERNKPSREERKAAALSAIIEKNTKKSGRGGYRRGQSATSTPLSYQTKTGSSGRGKRKVGMEDELARADTETAASSTPLIAPPRKRWVEQIKNEERCSPTPSSLSSCMTSPMRDDNDAASSPIPTGGKKKWLARHNEEVRAAEAATTSDIQSTSQLTSTRSKRNSRREAAEVLATMASSSSTSSQDISTTYKADIRANIVALHKSLSRSEPTPFSIDGVPSISSTSSHLPSPLVTPITPVIIPSLSSTTRTSSLRKTVKMTTESIPSTSHDTPQPSKSDATPPTPEVLPVAQKKKVVNLEEYRKRRRTNEEGGVVSGDSIGGGTQEKNDKPEPVKKSFIPSVHDPSVTGEVRVLPPVTLNESLSAEELRKRVYGDSIKRSSVPTSDDSSHGTTSYSTPSSSAPKSRMSINERLRAEFQVNLPPTPSQPPSSRRSTPPMNELTTLRRMRGSSIDYDGGGRGWTSTQTHHERLSDTMTMISNIAPPGLMDRPRLSTVPFPMSSSSPDTATRRTSSIRR